METWKDYRDVIPRPLRRDNYAKIFGRLTCGSGKHAKKENWIFFHTWEDAVEAGFRPCKVCKPEKLECDHMPFGLTGGYVLALTETARGRIGVSCTLCEKLLGTQEKK